MYEIAIGTPIRFDTLCFFQSPPQLDGVVEDIISDHLIVRSETGILFLVDPMKELICIYGVQ